MGHLRGRLGPERLGGWVGIYPPSAAHRAGKDNKSGPLLTGCVTLGKLLNLSEP